MDRIIETVFRIIAVSIYFNNGDCLKYIPINSALKYMEGLTLLGTDVRLLQLKVEWDNHPFSIERFDTGLGGACQVIECSGSWSIPLQAQAFLERIGKSCPVERIEKIVFYTDAPTHQRSIPDTGAIAKLIRAESDRIWKR